MNRYSISKLLLKKGFSQKDSDEIQEFLLPFLEYDPD